MQRFKILLQDLHIALKLLLDLRLPLKFAQVESLYSLASLPGESLDVYASIQMPKYPEQIAAALRLPAAP